MNLQTQPQHLLKGLLTIVLLLCSTLSLFAQVYSDEDIGFNREQVRQMYLEEGAQEEDLHKLLTLSREALLENYLIALSGPYPMAATSLGCGNIDFSNGFEEWCYKRVRRVSFSCKTPFEDVKPDFSGVGCINTFPSSSGSGIYKLNSSLSGYENIDNNEVIPNAIFNDLDLIKFGDQMIRLGDNRTDYWVERIEKKITITNENSLFSYQYAVFLQEAGHCEALQPYFTIYVLNQNNQPIPCSEFTATAGFTGIDCANFKCFIPTTTNTLNLLDYGSLGDEITIVVEVADCGLGGHYGYAFFRGSCTGIDGAIVADTNGQGLCVGVNITFNSLQDYYGENLSEWEILSGNSIVGSDTAPTITHYFSEPGEYTIKVTIPLEGYDCYSEIIFTQVITIEECPCVCECDSFTPVPGERYVVSGWVYEEYGPQTLSYENTSISLRFDRYPYTVINRLFKPSGQIIDGWQRIFGEFVVPSNTKSISISLNNENTSANAYFDDIRIHPYNSNLKSFVYDQETQQLMAELDENNYATFYEYDKEGGLIRIKKETERGVYTIQETRSGNSQLNIPQN